MPPTTVPYAAQPAQRHTADVCAVGPHIPSAPLLPRAQRGD
ncbi:hypothetical protein [Intrasporangium sp.]|nr:hypothetical protein [Intrasporangium sp.]